MIPTQRLKSNLKNLKAIVKPAFSFTMLNKSSSKYHSYTGHLSLGVKSDLIYIYSPIKNKNQNYSFSFVFDFMDKEEDKHTVQACYKFEQDLKYDFDDDNSRIEQKKKANESIVRSKFYTVDEFRLLLNDLNKKLTVLKAEQTTNKPFDSFSIFAVFNSVFINDVIDINNEVEKQSLIVSNFLKDKVAEKEDSETLLNKSLKSLKSAKIKVAKDLESSNEYKNLLLLKEQVKQLERAVKAEHERLNVKYKILEKEKAIVNCKKNVDSTIKNLENLKNEATKEMPAIIKHLVTVKIKK